MDILLKKSLAKAALPVVLFLFATNVQAATYTLLEHATLATTPSPGLDGLFTNGDDIDLSTIIPGYTNTSGAASGGYSPFNPLFNATNLTGLFTTSTAFQLGTFDLNSYPVGIESFEAGTIGTTLNTVATLDLTKTNQITWSNNNTFKTEFTHLFSGFTNVLVPRNSNGFYLLKGQDPGVIFAGNSDLIDHFNFLIPLLPTDWTYVGTELYSSLISSTTSGGIFNGTITSYSVDAPVPIPPALPLFVSALVFLGLRKRTK